MVLLVLNLITILLSFFTQLIIGSLALTTHYYSCICSYMNYSKLLQELTNK